MKIQDVKKECLATIGLSVEFSNSEISSLNRLLTTVSDAVEKTVEETHTFVESSEGRVVYKENDKIYCKIDLKSLKRVEWLLVQLTRKDTSGLFEQADADYRGDLSYINNIPANSTALQ